MRLLCSATSALPIEPTTYGKNRFSTGSYGAPFYAAVGLLLVRVLPSRLAQFETNPSLKFVMSLQIQGTPTLRPLPALQLQSQLLIRLSDANEGDVTSQSLINTGTTDVPKYMK